MKKNFVRQSIFYITLLNACVLLTACIMLWQRWLPDVNCYIKYGNQFCWVDDDGVWLSQYNTTTPDAGYRLVYNIAMEHAFL